MHRFLLVGGSGLVGSEAAKILAKMPKAQITALVRRPGAVTALLPSNLRPRIQELIFDFGKEPSDLPQATFEALRCDIMICAIGTTIKKAGSKAAFRAVDLDIPLRLIQLACRLAPPPVFAIVSATGADRGLGLYLGIKAEVEAALKTSGLRAIVARPSLLLGARTEHRLGEALASKLVPPLFHILDRLGLEQNRLLSSIRPIQGADVARALINASIAALPQRNDGGMSVLEGASLLGAGKSQTSNQGEAL